MACCGKCIGDRHILRHVIPRLSSTTGVCDYCGAPGGLVIAPDQLRDDFELLLAIYVEHVDGVPLLELLTKDWMLFEKSNIAADCAARLLKDIFDDYSILEKRFVPSAMCQSDSLQRWDRLRAELMYSNRFFPRSDLDLARLQTLLPHLLSDPLELSARWYRARLQQSAATFPMAEMGAPPPIRAAHGRANPAGIPYLYLASTIATAIAETRPHTSEVATVADVFISADLKLVDLRAPRRTVSPFGLESEEQIGMLHGDIGFLERLGEELTRPVLPLSAAIDYIPSQYLCEFVKNCGFDGVVYKSSVGEGVNLALFAPEKGRIDGVTHHRVTSIWLELAQLGLAQ